MAISDLLASAQGLGTGVQAPQGSSSVPNTSPAPSGGIAKLLAESQKNTPTVQQAVDSVPAPKQSLGDKISAFGDKVSQYGAEMDTSAIRSAGSILGSLQSAGNWLLSPLNKAFDKVTGTTAPPVTNAQDIFNNFADHLDKNIQPKDSGYIDNVFKGLGTAIPYIAGGAFAKAAQIPSLVSSLGIGAIQALGTARDDYHQMVDNGDKNAPAKAAGVFAVDLALNTAAHYLGPLAQGGDSSIASSVGRFLKSTVLETTNYGFGQTVVNNVATDQPPMKGVWDAVLTMAPISALIGAGAETANRESIKQVEGVIKNVADNGGTHQDAVTILSKLSGVPEDKVSARVDSMRTKDFTLDDKFIENENKGQTSSTPTPEDLNQIVEQIKQQNPAPVEKPVSTGDNKISDEAYNQTVKNGGVTISLEGNQPTKGIAYAPDKATQFVLPKNEMTPEIVDNYMKTHDEALKQEGNHLGMWESDGKIYLDVSKVGDSTPATFEEAMKGNQLEVHDLSTHEDIPLGKEENGVYTRNYEKASDHPYFNEGKDTGTGPQGTESKSGEVQEGSKVQVDNKETTITSIKEVDGTSYAKVEGHDNLIPVEKLKSTAKERDLAAKKPIETGGKKTESKSVTIDNMKEHMTPEEFAKFKDETSHEKASRVEQVSKAKAFVNDNPEATDKIIFGDENPPKGLRQQDILTEARIKAQEQYESNKTVENFENYNKYVVADELYGSKSGSELGARANRFDENDPASWLQKARDIINGKSNIDFKERGKAKGDIIKRETKKATDTVSRTAKKLIDYQKIIDSVTC